MPTGNRHPRGLLRPRQQGFALAGLLLATALLALTGAQSLERGASLERREAEAQLIADGLALQQALRSYAGVPRHGPAAARPPAHARGPRTLQELLRDTRTPGLRRHLRHIPFDPLTGRNEWGLLRDPDGFITGVHSLAAGRPLKQAGFPGGLSHFGGAHGYDGWVFGIGVGSSR